MHIHVTDTTYKLLDRKTYEVQERPKMTINGTMSITTYFILNKKDRTGKGQIRPFHSVLENMKKQETEEAKLKQSSSLKAGAIQNSPVPPKENGILQPSSPLAPAPVPAPMPQQEVYRMNPESIEIPVPVKTVRHEDVPSGYAQQSMSKNRIPDEHHMRAPEMMSGSYESSRYYDRESQRSRACEIL